jgi:hypothetical protein
MKKLISILILSIAINSCLSGSKPQKDSIAEIIGTKVICKEPGRYIGWPTIAKTKTNELLVVFSGNRDAHICPYGVTQMVRSIDQGVTWSAPSTINNTPLDDRDAGILETTNGTLLVSWFTSLAFDRESQYKEHPDWLRHAGKLSEDIKKQWLGNWTRRSTDNGQTWEEPVRQIASAPHGPIELHDNRLLYVGIGTINGKKSIAVEESKDEGKTWNLISTIPCPEVLPIQSLWEPHAVEVSNDTIIALVRYNNPKDKADGYLQQSESYDGGKTWSILHQTPVFGFPAHLLKLRNGDILAVYGVRKKPYSERACLSKDGGKTWDTENEIILSEGMSGYLGYPASVELEDGSILTVYYQIDQPGEKTCLMGTRWRLK